MLASITVSAKRSRTTCTFESWGVGEGEGGGEGGFGMTGLVGCFGCGAQACGGRREVVRGGWFRRMNRAVEGMNGMVVDVGEMTPLPTKTSSSPVWMMKTSAS